MIDIDALKRDKRPQSAWVVHALIDRLEAAESEAIEQARLNGMGSEREAALMAKLEAAEKERDNANAAAAGVALHAGAMQDRLEAAEKSDAESIAMYRRARDERDTLRAAVRHESDCVEAAKAEIKALRARIEAMEKQEPVAWLHETRRDSDVVTDAVKHVWGKVAVGSMAAYSIPLYALPGAKGEKK